MIEFLASGVSTQFQGKRIIVKRPGVGYYYRLLDCIYTLNKTSEEIADIFKSKDPKEILQSIKDKAHLIVQKKPMTKNLRVHLDEFVEGVNVKRLKESELMELVKIVLEVNASKRDDSEEPEKNERKKEPDFDENYNRLIYIISKVTGYDPETAAVKINNVQAGILLRQYEKDQYEQATLMRMAYHADANGWRQYRARVLRRKLLTRG
jgi:hypothetical protein